MEIDSQFFSLLALLMSSVSGVMIWRIKRPQVQADAIASLVGSIDRMTASLDKRDLRINELETENRKTREALDIETHTMREDFESKIRDLNSDKDELRIQVRDLAVNGGKQDKEIEILSKDRDLAQKANADLLAKNTELANDVVRLKVQIHDLSEKRDKEVSGRDKEITKLQEQIQERDKRIGDLEAKVEKLETEIKVKQSEPVPILPTTIVIETTDSKEEPSS